jgi:hypothetical protein
MRQFLVFPTPAVTFNFQNPSFITNLLYDLLNRHVELILIFLENPPEKSKLAHPAEIVRAT